MADSGTYSSNDLARRRRLAESMLESGMSTGPVGHWSQGAARLAQALMGGIGISRLEKEEKEREAAYAAALSGLLGGSETPAPAPNASTPPPISSAAPSAAPDDLAAFVREREGFALEAKPDFQQDSNGYGTKAQFPGETITPEEAEKRMQAELGKARMLVQGMGVKLTPKQEDALTDLTYNAGPKWMASGLGEAVRSGDWSKASDLFTQYTRAGGEVQPGLVSRRQALAANLLDGGPAAAATPPMALGGPRQAAGANPAISADTGEALTPEEEEEALMDGEVAVGAPTQTVAQAAPADGGLGQVDAATRQRIQALLANPATRPLGEALAKKVLENVPKAMTPLDQARLEKANADAAVSRAKLPKGPEEAGAQFTGALEQLGRFPQEFGPQALERAIGPWSATDPNPDSASGIWGSGVSISQLGQQVARGIGEAKAAVQGGASPTEVRDRIETATKNLAAVMKPFVRKPGEGAWSDKDQANLEAQIGMLTRSRSVEEYERRLEDIRGNVSKIFRVPTAAPRDLPRSPTAPTTAEDEETWFERNLWPGESAPPMANMPTPSSRVAAAMARRLPR